MTHIRKMLKGSYRKFKDVKASKEWRKGNKGIKLQNIGGIMLYANGKRKMLTCKCGSKEFDKATYVCQRCGTTCK